MSRRTSVEINMEIASIQDHMCDLYNETGDASKVDPDGELQARVDRAKEELKIVEQIEELENMEDYGRNSPMDRFEDFLNEVCDEIQIGTLCYIPSEVLKRVDPIAFREAYWEWAQSEIEALEDMIRE